MCALPIRRWLRQSFAGACHHSGLLQARRRLRQFVPGRDSVCIFGLHRVLNDAEWSCASSPEAMMMRDETFAALLRHLHNEFEVLSLAQFLDVSQGRFTPRRPACLITFDDGWGDTATRAFPLLREFDLPAVVFVTTGVLGHRDGFWIERFIRTWRNPALRPRLQAGLSSLPAANGAAARETSAIEFLKHMPDSRRRPILTDLLNPADSNPANQTDRLMTWQEVESLARAGIAFGGHTVTHPLLTYESDDAVRTELLECRLEIEKRLGAPVTAFAYPNGAFDDRVRSWAGRTGYTCAFSITRGWYSLGDDPFSIRRILLHEGCVTAPDGRFSPAALHFTLSRRD